MLADRPQTVAEVDEVAVERRLARRERTGCLLAAETLCVRLLLAELRRREVRPRREVRERRREGDTDCERGESSGERPALPARQREHEEAERKGREGRPRDREEERGRRERRERDGPA